MTNRPTPDANAEIQPPESNPLRERAENNIALSAAQRPLQTPPALSTDAQLRLVHELHVHQIELELQNDELRRAKDEIEVSKARYFELYDLAPVGYCIVSEAGLVLEANLTLSALLGVNRSVLSKQPLSRYIAREDQDIYYRMRHQLLADVASALTGGQTASCELHMVKGDGSQFWALLSATVASVQVAHSDSTVVQLRLTLSDISVRKQADAKIQLAASVFTHAREGIMVANASGNIIEVNDAFTRITGYNREDVIGRNPRFLRSGRQDPAFYTNMWRSLVEQGHWSGEIWNRHKNGEVYPELLTISAVRDEQGGTQQYSGLFSDISAIKAHQSQLEHIAHFDSLTNLPNRVLLTDRLLQGLAHATRRGETLAVVYLDLDGFKSVNDHHGHDVGDQLLIALATNMKESLRNSDTLARIGGDEFVAVLTDLTDSQACLPMLTRLLSAAAQKVSIKGLMVQATASLGVTFFPQAHAVEPDQLLRQADLAMYQAKLAGGNRYHVFDAALDSDLRIHHEGLQQIQHAMEHHEFVLHYQPKVNMRTGQIIGAEALIRWLHPERGLLAPGTFLPVIEEHPMAVTLGEWVIDAALAQVGRWHAMGLVLPVSVNIGAYQLQRDDFVERLQAILAKHPLVNPSCLELEILETSALSDMAQVSKVIDACAQIGIPFSLDDFGTGYSSLTYLKRLRVTTLKIDQSFVRDMLENPDDLAILQGVIGLAAAFKREVIAEGVETIAHGTALLALGCELAQGYGISRPMSGDALPAWAATWRPDAAWCSLRTG